MHIILTCSICVFLLFNTIGIAQIKKPLPTDEQKPSKSAEKDYSKELVKDSATNLIIEAANEASKLSALSDKISIKIEVVKILAPIKRIDALDFLESAWQDVSSVS